MATRYQLRLLRQQWAQILWREQHVFVISGRTPPFNGEAMEFGEPDPRTNVGFMIDLGEHEFAVGWEVEDLGEVGE